MARPRRMKIAYLSMRQTDLLLRSYYSHDMVLAVRPRVDIPEDVEVKGVHWDVARGAWAVYLYHESWNEVPDGHMIPTLEDPLIEFEHVSLPEYLLRLGWKLVPADPGSSC